MSLLEQASLIVTPNAVKESVLYSVIPIDGSGDMDVVRATTATRVNSEGLIENVGLNIPRIDYTNGSCPSILVEPQRTNLVLRSEEFDNAYWAKTNSTAITNQIVSPNGTLTADKLNETANSGYHIFASGNITSGTYTSSVFVKKGERNFVLLWNNGSNSGRFFDIENGTLGGTLGAIPLNSNIEDYGDGWFRCSITNNNVTNFGIYIAISSTLASYLGEVGKGIYTFGAQLEAGSNATSYIPTVASAVTRNADNISKTGISSLIGQIEGVLYANVKFNSLGTGDSWLSISSGNNVNWIFIGKASGKIRGYAKGNGVVIFDNSVTNITSNQLMKIAIAYKSENIALYINGSLIATSTNSFTFSSDLSLFALDSSSGISENISETTIYQEIILFKTRLSNAELATLTTL